MSNEISSLEEFDTSELSEEDLAVLQAFEAMDAWPTEQSWSETNRPTSRPEVLSPREDKEMLLIFATEAEEDITSIRQLLNQLVEHDQQNLACFNTLRRLGHKLYGTAGAVGFPLISRISAHVELIAEEVSHGTISTVVGVEAISTATIALEVCILAIVSESQEPEATTLLESLEATYQSLHIDLQQIEQRRTADDQIDTEVEKILLAKPQVSSKHEHSGQDHEMRAPPIRKEITVPLHISSEDLQQGPSSVKAIPPIHVDAQRFEHLALYTEKLVEQRTTVEDAQAQLEYALQELYMAQARLQRLEPLIANLQKGEKLAPSLSEGIHASSLIARILHESVSQNQQPQKHLTSLSKTRQSSVLEHTYTTSSHTANTKWDNLEIEQYNEQELAQHALKDAIADLAITTANVQSAFTHFSIVQQDCLANITHVHRDTLLLHQVAFATLVPRLERVVTMSAPGQAQQIRFNVVGGETEIGQDILNTLATPLVQFLRTCLVDPVILEEVATPPEKGFSPPPRVWLKVTNHGNRLTFEIGFSMPIQGGAIETIRQPIQQLRGTISLQRNAGGGISFFLSIPHPHSGVVCLLVQAGDQHLLVPFNQIQRISTTDKQPEKTELRYSLQELLSFPSAEPRNSTSQQRPLLLVNSADGTTEDVYASIIVDEVLGEQECIIKPLPAYLERPGIAGTTIDGKGRILLMVDLLALIRSAPHYSSSSQPHNNALPQPHRAKILVTDDSAALRHSLIQTLQHASYAVFEARDGVEALEKLERQKPDICLLDVEMPNLNGYDVLQIMRTNLTMSTVKVVMLTSRGTIKHMQYALELGARAYLTKPCAQDDLFQTLERVLKE